jgi:predicted CXXCH cytochrome family protein
MTGRRKTRFGVHALACRAREHSIGLVLLFLGLSTLLLLIGCGTPQQRYHTLSTFFDGVPNPDAPSKTRADDAGHMVMAASRIVSQHKPYLDNQCAACHQSNSGEIQDFALAYNACVKCHKQISKSKPLMHGPVALEQCKWCHAPHQSTEPALLKDTPIAVCTQCHDKQLLSNTPPEHVDGKTSCLQCHFGHGGPEHNFLKPTASMKPSTAPTTGPGEGLSLPKQELSP